MQQVTLFIDVDKTLDIIHELRKHGWVQHVDFDFAYYKPEYENFTYTNNYEPMQEHRAIFTFYNESHASYFSLRWG